MLKTSFFNVFLTIMGCLVVLGIVAAVIADIYLFNVEVVKAKKPAHLTALCVVAVLVAIALIF